MALICFVGLAMEPEGPIPKGHPCVSAAARGGAGGGAWSRPASLRCPLGPEGGEPWAAGPSLLSRQSLEDCEVRKQNCPWLLVSHGACAGDQVLSALKKARGDAVLKFEPFVLHVRCRQLRDAQLLHSAAIDSGFRNSGITVGKRGKTMLAVRSTHSLEVPLSHKGRLMVTEEYIDFLLKIANQKMEENKKRIERFYSCLQLALEREEAGGLQPETKETALPVYTHRRKRRTEKTHGRCNSPEKQKDLGNDEDDAEISLDFFPENY